MMKPPLFIGVDVHRKTNTFCVMAPSGAEVVPRFTLENNRPGTERLIQKVSEIMQADGFSELRLAAEATGWYWFHFFETLRNDPALHGWPVELFALNPRLTANFKKSYVDVEKSDPIGAYVIGDRLRWGRALPQPFAYDEKLLALHFLTRDRYHLVHQLASEKAYCTVILYLKASEYTRTDKQAFSNLCSAASRAVLQEFASIEEVAALPFDELLEFIDRLGKRRFADPAQTARRLQQIASDSHHLSEALQPSINQVLSLSLKHIQHLQNLIQRLETAITQQMRAIPQTLNTIPGLGPVFSAGIIAEIGGVERFDCDESKVAKFADFKWRKSASADFQAQETRLTRTGNAYLRDYFCEAAFALQMWDRDYGAYFAN